MFLSLLVLGVANRCGGGVSARRLGLLEESAVGAHGRRGHESGSLLLKSNTATAPARTPKRKRIGLDPLSVVLWADPAQVNAQWLAGQTQAGQAGQAGQRAINPGIMRSTTVVRTD